MSHANHCSFRRRDVWFKNARVTAGYGYVKKQGAYDELTHCAADLREKAEYFLDLVGLRRFMHANVHELSGGMKQRVALARSLAPNPGVLLMDEPFGALDALTRELLYGDIQRIWSQHRKTIVFVTHNVREAVCLGDRVILFSPNPGRISNRLDCQVPCAERRHGV